MGSDGSTSGAGSEPPGGGPRPWPDVRKAYRRTALLGIVGLVAWWTVLGTPAADEPGRAAAPPKAQLPVPTPFVVRGAALTGPDEAFQDVTDDAGVSTPHRAARATRIALPTEQLLTLMGTPQLPPQRDIDRWAEAVLTPYLTEMTSLEYFATGQAWGDYDGDGLPDLYLTSQQGPNALLRNQGDGTFERAPVAADVAAARDRSGGAQFVDVDNDGWPDLHLLNDGPDRLFLNQDGRGFRDVTDRAGIADPGQGQTAAWGDVDGDGLLDVYVVNYGCQPCNDAPPVPRGRRDQDRLYRNLGDGRFEDVTSWIDDVPGTRGLGFSAAWFDADGDGDVDLYVVNDVRDDRADGDVAAGRERGDGSTPGNTLLRNDGPGCGGWCLTDVTAASGADVRANAMGLAVGDLDGDGDLDLFFTNSGFHAGPTHLLLNEGDGRFDEAGPDLGANLAEWSWGTNVLDADADGNADLFVAVGFSELAMQAMPSELPDPPASADVGAVRAGLRDGSVASMEPPGPPPWPAVASSSPRTNNDRLLLRTAGGYDEVVLGRTDVFAPSTLGSATADYDGDGRTDLVVGDLDSGYRLLRNTGALGAGNRRAVILLRGNGTTVNRDAIGAVVTVEGTDGRRRTLPVMGGGSLGSGNDLRLVIGLGPAELRRVEVAWPDGTMSVHDDLPTDHHLTVVQGVPDVPARPLRNGA